MSAHDTWLASRPTIPLFPAIRHPRKLGFFERLFRRRGDGAIPSIATLILGPEGIDSGSAGINWADQFAVQLSRDLDAGELGVRLRQGRTAVSFRVLAPEEWLDQLDAPTKEELFPFIHVEAMARIWECIAHYSAINRHEGLPVWPEPTAFELVRESVDPPRQCTACDSFHLRLVGDDIFICNQCGYEGGEGVLRRLEAQRRAELLLEDYDTVVRSRFIHARRSGWAALESLELAGGYAPEGLSGIEILSQIQAAREALRDVTLIRESSPRTPLDDALDAVIERIRLTTRAGPPNLVQTRTIVSAIESLVANHPSAAPPGKERNWQTRALFLAAEMHLRHARDVVEEQPTHADPDAALERMRALLGEALRYLRAADALNESALPKRGELIVLMQCIEDDRSAASLETQELRTHIRRVATVARRYR